MQFNFLPLQDAYGMSNLNSSSKPQGYSPDIRKIFIKGSRDDIAVPFNELNLSNGEKILSYTVEGGNNFSRKSWIAERHAVLTEEKLSSIWPRRA